MYVLVIGKNGPKLRKSEDDGEPALESDANRFNMILKKVSIPTFTEHLARGLSTAVIDQTGLSGRYDITINIGKYLAEQDNGIPDIFAIFSAGVQELGLKLERRKLPLELLIVDRADKVPAQN